MLAWLEKRYCMSRMFSKCFGKLTLKGFYRGCFLSTMSLILCVGGFPGSASCIVDLALFWQIRTARHYLLSDWKIKNKTLEGRKVGTCCYYC